jgi:hypothetical protein
MPTTVIAGAGQLCAAGGPGLLFGGRDQGLAYASAAVALVDDQCDQTPELSGHLEQREVANAAYLDFAFPYYWHYDALGYFRRQGTEPDSRMAEAVEVVRSKPHRTAAGCSTGSIPVASTSPSKVARGSRAAGTRSARFRVLD